MDYFERVAPLVDDTIAKLAAMKFPTDPIAGEKHSRSTSIVSSAYKRHGTILEAAMVEGMRESNRHKIWKDDGFKVSAAADHLVSSQSDAECLSTSVPYAVGVAARHIQVDLLAFDYADETIRSYEIKRGFGQFDAGKIRSIRRDLRCAQVLLRSYGQVQKLEPKAAEARIVFYYGRRSIPRPWSLIKEELDDHFQFPIVERVERVNSYFREKLHALLETI